MGTRSLTRVNNSEGVQYLNLYLQYDGYPSGHGDQLFNFLKDIEIVNGYQGGMHAGTHANGSGCLSAQLVSHFKKDIGGFYLYPTSHTDCGQDYEYVITITECSPFGAANQRGEIAVKVISYGHIIFDGSVNEFGAWCKKSDDE